MTDVTPTDVTRGDVAQDDVPQDDVTPERAVMIRLRARLAVVERAAWFGLVAAMRARPAETEATLTAERAKCAEGYGRRGWAADLTDAERAMLGAEVDAGLAGLIEDAKAEIGQV